MTPAAAIRAAPPVRTAGYVLAVVAGLAVVGVWLALGALGSGRERPSVLRVAPPSGAWDAAASFGPVSVQRVERFAGVVHQGHGSNLRADQIRVTLSVTNRGRAAIPFSPGQFRLRLDRVGTTVSATRPNPPPGVVAPGQTLHQRLTFDVSDPRTSFTLVFDDLGRRTPLPIELGALAAGRKH